MKHVVKIFMYEELVSIDKPMYEIVEKASRHILKLHRGQDEKKFKFKLNTIGNNTSGLLYRNDSDSMEQIKVFVTELITLD